MQLQIAHKFELGPKIGEGSFGIIYRGTNLNTGGGVAIKLEAVTAPQPQLLYESKIYKMLDGGPGIPAVHWSGNECEFNAIVMELLGPSLEDYMVRCNEKFSLKTVLMLVDQMLERVEYVHAKGFIHRDIKPDNFLMGIGQRAGEVYLVDFGISKTYRDLKTQQHIPFKSGKGLTGTARYSSINVHNGDEQSRRDDLESLGYVLMYFNKGKLPWFGLRAKEKKEKIEKIGEWKRTTPLEELCRAVPEEFVTYLRYCRNLSFEEQPDYNLLRGLFKRILLREGYEYDCHYDWSNFAGAGSPKAEGGASRVPSPDADADVADDGGASFPPTPKSLPLASNLRSPASCDGISAGKAQTSTRLSVETLASRRPQTGTRIAASIQQSVESPASRRPQTGSVSGASPSLQLAGITSSRLSQQTATVADRSPPAKLTPSIGRRSKLTESAPAAKAAAAASNARFSQGATGVAGLAICGISGATPKVAGSPQVPASNRTCSK